VASSYAPLSASPGAPCSRMTALSTLFARGWTRGLGLGASLSRCTAKASTYNGWRATFYLEFAQSVVTALALAFEFGVDAEANRDFAGGGPR